MKSSRNQGLFAGHFHAAPRIFAGSRQVLQAAEQLSIITSLLPRNENSITLPCCQPGQLPKAELSSPACPACIQSTLAAGKCDEREQTAGSRRNRMGLDFPEQVPAPDGGIHSQNPWGGAGVVSLLQVWLLPALSCPQPHPLSPCRTRTPLHILITIPACLSPPSFAIFAVFLLCLPGP